MTNGNRYEVAVVGAGPAGASAARLLAVRGHSVLLLEKDELPRYKVCGGGVVLRARRSLEVDISGAVDRECRSAELHGPNSGSSLTLHREDPMISMTMRARLDHLLVREAERAGADVWSGCRVADLSQDRSQVTLETTAGPVVARFVIAADGAMSTVARAAGWPDDRDLIPALESELFVDEDVFERLGRTARFDFDVVPNGYAWVFPKAEHLSIGVLSTRRGRARLPGHLKRYYESIGVEGIRDEQRHGFVIPIRPRRAGFVKGRVLLVGDAAGFADPVTAEGISFAIQSAQLAAGIVAAAEDDTDRVAIAYHRELRRTILPELRIGRWLCRPFYGHPRLRASILKRYGGRLAGALADVFSGQRTYRSLVSSPGNYLGLLLSERSSR